MIRISLACTVCHNGWQEDHDNIKTFFRAIPACDRCHEVDHVTVRGAYRVIKL